MSGVEIPPLGSFKDRTLRKFMTLESKRKLKSDELNLAIALLNCQDKAGQAAVNGIWKELAELEYGVGYELMDEKKNLERNWQAMYDRMQEMKVQLVRNGTGLSVQGLQ